MNALEGLLRHGPIACALHPYLALADICAIMCTQRWSREWRVHFTMCFQLQARAKARWPRSNIYTDLRDMTIYYRNRALDALKPILPGTIFACWHEGSDECGSYVGDVREVNRAVCPHSTCTSCLVYSIKETSRFIVVCNLVDDAGAAYASLPVAWRIMQKSGGERIVFATVYCKP